MKQLELPTAESVIDLINKLEVQIAQNGNNSNRDAKAEKVADKFSSFSNV